MQVTLRQNNKAAWDVFVDDERIATMEQAVLENVTFEGVYIHGTLAAAWGIELTAEFEQRTNNLGPCGVGGTFRGHVDDVVEFRDGKWRVGEWAITSAESIKVGPEPEIRIIVKG